MDYLSWFQAHREKHKAIMEKLTKLSDAEVISYFKFENMVEQELDFCPLYKENKKCHDMKELNCYLCACPNFRFDDDGLKKREDKALYSICNINSKDGGQYILTDAIHQDCSKCGVPHYEAYIQKIFSRDWFEMMEKVLPQK